jgi:hypothetical protein
LFDASAVFYAEVHAVVNSISTWQDVRARCGWGAQAASLWLLAVLPATPSASRSAWNQASRPGNLPRRAGRRLAPRRSFAASAYRAPGLGGGVGRGLGVARDRGVGVGLGDGVGLDVAVAVGVEVGLDVTVAVAVGVGVGVDAW